MADGIAVVGIVGAGTMGAGIGQVALEAGHEVVLYDVDEVARERGLERIRDGLARRAAKLDLDADAVDDWVEGRLANVRHAHTLEALGAEAGLGIVLEAAAELLDLKQDVFRALDASTEPDVILATNTSSLSVTAIAEACEEPDRVIGAHFFNPAPVMRLVEVVPGSSTSDATRTATIDLLRAWGKVPVRSADTPGFIVNRVNRPFTIEALRILEEGEAGVGDIDRAIRGAGFRMGPFELMDLTGIDITFAAATAIWERLGHPDRLRPSPIQQQLVEAGHLGRKTGHGFYDYSSDPPGWPDPGYPSVSDALGPLDPDAIVRRIRGAILDEARLAAAEHVASEEDIDRALTLGAAHPQGPFAWAREHPATG
jgi:3-hydroxybutyryl-CoA dehydrogenase